MDVAAAADPTFRAVDSIPTPPPPIPGAGAPSGADGAGGSAVVAGSPGDGVSGAQAQPTLPTLPPAPAKKNGPIADDVIKLFNQQEQNVEVSYRVEKGLDEVVTVFTDKTTGKTIVQFPSETLIALAQLFDKIAGSVLDKKA